jgi:hypothetical protein
VLNAQHARASVALIADDVDESIEDLVMGDASGGYSGDLSIPGYMIDHKASLLLRAAESDIFIRSELSILTKNDRLELGLFMSSSVDVSY